MSAPEERHDNCPMCRMKRAEGRIGEPCELCGRELTDGTIWVQVAGVCRGCAATYRWPGEAPKSTESTETRFGLRRTAEGGATA